MSSRVGVKRGGSPGFAKQYSKIATEELSELIYNFTEDCSVIERINVLVGEREADPNIMVWDGKLGMSPLMYMVWVGREETNGPFHDTLLSTFKFLLDRDDIDVSMNYGRGIRLIQRAACMTDPEFLRILLENRIVCESIDVLNADGQSPLYHACTRSDISIQSIEYLLNAGANPNIHCGFLGRTPLQTVMSSCAYSYKNTDTYKSKVFQILQVFFRCAGNRLGDPDLCDNRGNTLLHCAAKCVRSRTVIDMLLIMGENRSLEVRNMGNSTPEESANAAGNTEALAAFREWRLLQVG